MPCLALPCAATDARLTVLRSRSCGCRWTRSWSVYQRDTAAVWVQLVDEPTMKILREFDIGKPGHTLMVPLNEGKNFTDKKLRDVNTFQQFNIDPSTMTTAAATQARPLPPTNECAACCVLRRPCAGRALLHLQCMHAAKLRYTSACTTPLCCTVCMPRM